MQGVARLTSLTECFIIKPCLANLESVPLIPVELLIDIDDIEVLILKSCQP